MLCIFTARVKYILYTQISILKKKRFFLLPANRVSLTFTNFGVAGNCESNYVSLADSLDPAITESSEVQHSLCGNSLPPMYTSRGSALTVVMNTTNINNIQFRAVYTSSDSGKTIINF